MPQETHQAWVEARRELYYQTRLSLEAAVRNGYMSVLRKSYCQQRDVSVSHGKLEKLVPTLWQRLGCTKGFLCVSQEAQEAGADYRMLQDMCQTNDDRMQTRPRTICSQRQNAFRPV
ncbi:hypothetical protein VPH35_031448 [Triticum aestivum]